MSVATDMIEHNIQMGILIYRSQIFTSALQYQVNSLIYMLLHQQVYIDLVGHIS